jgi:mannose-1-phosphate guanylyltransferase
LQALVLVGGKGTRLRPLTSETPKPILPLVDRPFLAYMIEWLASHGVDDIVFACGFLPDQLEAVLGAGEKGGPRLRYVTEPTPRGTAGAIKFAEHLLDDTFFALNGDVLTDLDLTLLWNEHARRGAQASLGLYRVEDTSAFGLVDHDELGEVLKFSEKDPEHHDSGLINAGTYVLNRTVLDIVAPDEDVSIETEVFPNLVGHGLYCTELTGYWKDIGTHDSYRDATWDILEGRVHTDVPVNAEGIHISPGATVSTEALIGPRAVIREGCEVGAGSVIRNSVLMPECVIGDDVTVESSILSPGVHVASGIRVGDRVIGKNEAIDA